MTPTPAPHKELPPVPEPVADGPHARTAIVVGGGPAGLRAAEILAGGGGRVLLFDQKPSVGRKFLVAGKGGLNLTHSEELPKFIERYGDASDRWRTLLETFGPAELRAWAAELGVETYVGTSGRVFPKGQQAAVLLRRWVARLRGLRVEFYVNHRLESLQADGAGGWQLGFRDVRSGETRTESASAVVLALGGASWPQTGSDGKWPAIFGTDGPQVHPWQAANCGWEVAWDARLLAAAEGKPLKNVKVSAGKRTVPGEALITRYGLEGGTVYQLGRELRAMEKPSLRFDLKPDVPEESIFNKLPPKKSLGWEEVAGRLKLSEAARALLEFHGPATGTTDRKALAAAVKNLAVELKGPRPIAEAISSGGGLAWDELDDDLMLTRMPGVYLAGEMIDWEAPTGGYLLQACFATGTRAGESALRLLRQTEPDHLFGDCSASQISRNATEESASKLNNS